MANELLMKSDLEGKPTNFHEVAWTGAKIDKINNITGAKLPNKEEFEKIKDDFGQQKQSLFKKIFGIMRSQS